MFVPHRLSEEVLESHQEWERQKTSQDTTPGGDVRLTGGKPDGNPGNIWSSIDLTVAESIVYLPAQKAL
jgi:hypothetical protein